MVRNAENLEKKKGEELQRIRTENTVRHGTKRQGKKKKKPCFGLNKTRLLSGVV